MKVTDGTLTARLLNTRSGSVVLVGTEALSLVQEHDRLTSSSRVMNSASLSRAPHRRARHADCNAAKLSPVRINPVKFP